MLVTEAAYVAGIVDGEGSIMVNRTSALDDNGFQARLSIANCSLALMQAVVRMTGTGSVVGRRVREGRRTAYQWVCPAPEVRRVLENILPFLVVKREHALLVLEFLGMRDQARQAHKRGVLPEDRSRRAEIVERLRELNRKGVDTPLEEGQVDRISVRPYASREKTSKEKEMEILELLLAGEMTALRIAESLGVDRTVVRRVARENGIETPYLSGERHWLNQRAVTGEGLREAECGHCGVKFETTHHKQKFCSPLCAEKAEQKKRVERRREALGLTERECELCGTKFRPARTNSRFCSRKCFMKDWKQRQKQE